MSPVILIFEPTLPSTVIRIISPLRRMIAGGAGGAAGDPFEPSPRKSPTAVVDSNSLLFVPVAGNCARNIKAEKINKTSRSKVVPAQVRGGANLWQ
jgi:hypothetical protein